jgi:hypothetical protein
MSALKCRLIKPPSLFIDHVIFNFEKHAPAGTMKGSLEVPVGAELEVGETYRVELPDGRAGQIRVTSFNDVSTKGEFEVIGSLD